MPTIVIMIRKPTRSAATLAGTGGDFAAGAAAVVLDLAERNRSDLARMLGRIASRVSPSANRHVMEGFVGLGGGESEDIARRWADALKSLAGRDTLAAEDLLCMEGATVKLRAQCHEEEL